MSEENNKFTDSDPCPDEQELKSYASGEMASTRSGRIIGCHLEFCPSCRSRVEKIRKTEVAVDEAIKVFAEKLKRQQEKLVFERWRGPQPGAIWRTVPESDEELLGPMVIVIKVNESGSLSVAEISEDVAQPIHTDMVLEPQASGLRFRFMIRAGNVFETTAEYLKTFAGQLPSALTNKVIEFCEATENFDSEIPLSKYKFGRDPNGTVLMYRKGITSGILVTDDGDPRLEFLELSKERCSYLTRKSATTASSWPLSRKVLDLVKRVAVSISQSAKKQVGALGEFKGLKDKIATIQAENAELKKKAAEFLAWKDEATRTLTAVWQRLKSVESGPAWGARMPSASFPPASEYEAVKPVDPKKGKAVLQAAQSGDLATLKRLVKDSRLADFADEKTGTPPLLLAAFNGHTAVVKFLLDKGANIHLLDKDAKTALILAATEGHRDIVQLLLKKGSNLRWSDNGGRTALYWALANGHEEIAQDLRFRSGF